MSTTKILVWDVPTRVFHWLLAISFAGAYLTAESEAWRLVHVTLGYTFGGLILFRLLWGLIGTANARFSHFAYGPRRVWDYLRSLLVLKPQHYVGHNPAGSWAVFAILALGLGVALSGFALYNDIGGEAFEEAHEVFANLTLTVVVIHVLGVIVSSFLHHENLPRAMVTGYKDGDAAQAISGPRWAMGVALVAVVMAFWVNAFGIRESLVGASPAEGGADSGHLQGDDDHDD
ncbi:MAG: cytochrome b/b6 domain-containing protein [Pseudomonadota bacterium]